MTGRRTEEVTVGDRLFRVSQLPATRGQMLFARLCRILVPPAAKALGGKGFSSLGDLLGGDLGGIADGASMLADRLTETEQRDVFKELFSDAMLRSDDGKFVKLADVYEDAFAGRVSDIYKLAFEALKLNFADFFGALNSAISAANAKAEAEQMKPKAAA